MERKEKCIGQGARGKYGTLTRKLRPVRYYSHGAYEMAWYSDEGTVCLADAVENTLTMMRHSSKVTWSNTVVPCLSTIQCLWLM